MVIRYLSAVVLGMLLIQQVPAESYHYDELNRLIRVEKDGKTIAAYAYGPGEPRVKKTEKKITTKYFFPGKYEEASDGTITKYYSGGGVTAQRTNGKLAYLHKDILQSTTTVTDSNGAILTTYRYAPYGETDYEEGRREEIVKKYTGQEEDKNGLYYYGARYYDTELGRFMTADTIYDIKGSQNDGVIPSLYRYYAPYGTTDYKERRKEETVKKYIGQEEDKIGKEEDQRGLHYYETRYYAHSLGRFTTTGTIYAKGSQGLNRYAYTENNPIMFTDPTGHFIVEADDPYSSRNQGLGGLWNTYDTAYVSPLEAEKVFGIRTAMRMHYGNWSFYKDTHKKNLSEMEKVALMVMGSLSPGYGTKFANVNGAPYRILGLHKKIISTKKEASEEASESDNYCLQNECSLPKEPEPLDIQLVIQPTNVIGDTIKLDN